MIGPKYAGNEKNGHYGDQKKGAYARYFSKMAPYNRLPDGPPNPGILRGFPGGEMGNPGPYRAYLGYGFSTSCVIRMMGGGRIPSGFPTRILRRRSGAGGLLTYHHEAIIPKKEGIIQGIMMFSRRRDEVIISIVWTADLLPHGLLDAGNEKNGGFGVRFQGSLIRVT